MKPDGNKTRRYTESIFLLGLILTKLEQLKDNGGLSASLSHVANLCEEQRTQKEGNGKLVQT